MVIYLARCDLNGDISEYGQEKDTNSQSESDLNKDISE